MNVPCRVRAPVAAGPTGRRCGGEESSDSSPFGFGEGPGPRFRRAVHGRLMGGVLCSALCSLATTWNPISPYGTFLLHLFESGVRQGRDVYEQADPPPKFESSEAMCFYLPTSNM